MDSNPIVDWRKSINNETFGDHARAANKIKVPSDIGRIPNKIATGDGFSGFTADQWKTFILIYTTTITWNLLKDDDKKYYLILYKRVISLYVMLFSNWD